MLANVCLCVGFSVLLYAALGLGTLLGLLLRSLYEWHSNGEDLWPLKAAFRDEEPSGLVRVALMLMLLWPLLIAGKKRIAFQTVEDWAKR